MINSASTPASTPRRLSWANRVKEEAAPPGNVNNLVSPIANPPSVMIEFEDIQEES